jgi:hypothetical protein
MSFKIKSEKVLSDKVGRLKSVSFELSDRKGTAKEHEEEIYEKADAVVVLLYNKEQSTVILTRQFRLATVVRRQQGWDAGRSLCRPYRGRSFSGGHGAKELEEETGYIVNDVVPVMKLIYVARRLMPEAALLPGCLQTAGLKRQGRGIGGRGRIH